MSPLVSGEVITSREHLITDSAGVWLVASMQTHMPGQHVTASKGAATNLALNINEKVNDLLMLGKIIKRDRNQRFYLIIFDRVARFTVTTGNMLRQTVII